MNRTTRFLAVRVRNRNTPVFTLLYKRKTGKSPVTHLSVPATEGATLPLIKGFEVV
jgi:hypothetical protein